MCVSGVRSSCEMLATKLAFSSPSSDRRSRASCNSTVRSRTRRSNVRFADCSADRSRMICSVMACSRPALIDHLQFEQCLPEKHRPALRRLLLLVVQSLLQILL